MKIGIYKSKNMYDEYTGQLDYDDKQIQVFANTAKERNELVKSCKKALKPVSKKDFEKALEIFLAHPYKDLYQDTLLLGGMRDAAKFAFDFLTK